MKKIVSFKSAAIAIVAALVFQSCATVFTGTSDYISFNSNPAGATVLIDGIELCKTPCREKVRRNIQPQDVEFKLDGYTTRVITLDQEFNIISVINLGNLIGWGVDAITGAMMKYGRNSYDVTLERKLASVNANKLELDTVNKTLTIYALQK